MKAILIRSGLALLTIVLLAAITVLMLVWRDSQLPETAAEVAVAIPTYHEAPVGFVHRHDGDRALPMAGGAHLNEKTAAMSLALADLNRDGEPDIVYLNLDGPMRTLLSDGRLERSYLEVAVPDSPRFLNAKVVVTLIDGRRMTDWFVGSEGLGTDQANRVVFGIASGAGLASIEVFTADGTVFEIDNPEPDQRLTITP